MSARIPKIFHFVYGLQPQTEPFHLVHYLALASCLEVNRPERVLLHLHHRPWGEYWERIADRVDTSRVRRSRVRLRYRDRRVERYRYAHEADFVRLDVLLEHGGVYADLDTIFVRPLPERLFAERFVLGREDDVPCDGTATAAPSLCNALIMAERGAEFARLWRARMAAAFDGSWSRHSTLLPRVLADEHPALIHVEPAPTFYPYMWTRDDLHRLLEARETVGAEVASVHLWAHLWWSKTRRDFSALHAGMLDEAFVRSVDTTYNLLARPFLPPPERGVRSAARRLHDLGARTLGAAQALPARGKRLAGRLTAQVSRTGS